MTTITVLELRQQIEQLEKHITATLNDFSEITGTTVDDLIITPVSRFGSSSTAYYVQLKITV
jgi:ribosomal protein L16 Arg81 hydroxylase